MLRGADDAIDSPTQEGTQSHDQHHERACLPGGFPYLAAIGFILLLVKALNLSEPSMFLFDTTNEWIIDDWHLLDFSYIHLKIGNVLAFLSGHYSGYPTRPFTLSRTAAHS